MKCCKTCKYFCEAKGIEIWCDKWNDIFAYKRWDIDKDYCSRWVEDKQDSGTTEGFQPEDAIQQDTPSHDHHMKQQDRPDLPDEFKGGLSGIPSCTIEGKINAIIKCLHYLYDKVREK